jgi:hypothetical protein
VRRVTSGTTALPGPTRGDLLRDLPRFFSDGMCGISPDV